MRVERVRDSGVAGGVTCVIAVTGIVAAAVGDTVAAAAAMPPSRFSAICVRTGAATTERMGATLKTAVPAAAEAVGTPKEKEGTVAGAAPESATTGMPNENDGMKEAGAAAEGAANVAEVVDAAAAAAAVAGWPNEKAANFAGAGTAAAVFTAAIGGAKEKENEVAGSTGVAAAAGGAPKRDAAFGAANFAAALGADGFGDSHAMHSVADALFETSHVSHFHAPTPAEKRAAAASRDKTSPIEAIDMELCFG
jgi:hypothetical protein